MDVIDQNSPIGIHHVSSVYSDYAMDHASGMVSVKQNFLSCLLFSSFMCLAIPGKLVAINDKNGVVDFFGVRRNVNLHLLEDASLGDYVLVHVGFAIQKIDEKIAKEEFRLLAEYAHDTRNT